MFQITAFEIEHDSNYTYASHLGAVQMPIPDGSCAQPHLRNYACRTQILDHLGLRVTDFRDLETAWKTVQDAVEDNKKTFEHNGEEVPNENGFLVRYFFVKSEGKTRSFSTTETKELEGTANLKTKKQLQDAESFIEGLGLAALEPSESSGVKVENAVYKDHVGLLEPLRSGVPASSQLGDSQMGGEIENGAFGYCMNTECAKYAPKWELQ